MKNRRLRDQIQNIADTIEELAQDVSLGTSNDVEDIDASVFERALEEIEALAIDGCRLAEELEDAIKDGIEKDAEPTSEKSA